MADTGGASDARAACTEIHKLASSLRPGSSCYGSAIPAMASLKKKPFDRAQELTMNPPMSNTYNNDNPSSSSSSSRLHNVFQSAFETIDIESDTFSLPLQNEFSSFLLHEMAQLRTEKPLKHPGDPDAVTEGEPELKRRRQDGNPCASDIFPNGQSSHEFHQFGDLFDTESKSEKSHKNGSLDDSQRFQQQKRLLFSWVAVQLRTAEQVVQRMFDDQEKVHREEIKALKAEHEREMNNRTNSSYAETSVIMKKPAEKAVLEPLEIEETDRSRVDDAFKRHSSTRRRLLQLLVDENHDVKRVREQIKREHHEYYHLKDAIYSQLKLQQCHHYNLQSLSRSTIAEKNSEVQRLGKALDEKSAELRLLQESQNRAAPATTPVENCNGQLMRQRQSLENGAVSIATENMEHELIQKRDFEVQRLQQRLDQSQSENSLLARRVEETMDQKSLIEANITMLRRQLYQEKISSSQLKAQLQEAVNIRRVNALSHSNAPNTQATNVLEKGDKEQSKEVKRIMLNHLEQSKACNYRLELMANEVKRLGAENRELTETLSTQEQSLEKTSKSLERLTERNSEYFQTIQMLTKDKT